MRFEQRAQRQLSAALGRQLCGHSVRSRAEIGGIDQEALLPTGEVEDGSGDWGVGDEFEAVPYTAVDRVDSTGNLDPDRKGRRPFEYSDQIGQGVVRGTQVYRPGERLIK